MLECGGGSLGVGRHTGVARHACAERLEGACPLGALALDWALATVVSIAFFGNDGLATLGIFAGVQVLFLVTVGGSIGHLVARLRVVPMAGGPLGLWRPVVRTLLICVVIPAVVWDPDQRGLHDRIAGTVLVRV